MGKTLRAPAHAAAKLFLLFLATSLVAVSPCPADEGKAAGDDLPATGDQVRCPDCNDEGKMVCPTCAGKGELAHACEICKGSGRRPCPVCRKDAADGVSGTTPGRVVCDSCAGKGTFGAQGKPCVRCGGAGTLSCTTCGGKGTLTCRKVVYDKICPTCGFVGKVTCTTCDGTTLVSPALLAARRAAAKKTDKAAVKPAEPAPRSPSSRAEEKPEAVEPPVVAIEFPARYTKLTQAYESHLDVFADDPKPKMDPKRREAAQLLKQLPPAEKGPGTVKGEVESFVAKIDNLRKRWTALRGLFDSERASYTKTKTLWESRESKVSGLPGRLRVEAEAELNKHLDIVLRITEKHSQALEREEPAWMAKELASIDATWPGLKARAEAKVEEASHAEAALKVKAAKVKRDAAAALARAAAKKPGTASKARTTSASRETAGDSREDANGVMATAFTGTEADATDSAADSNPAPRKSRVVGVVRHSDSRPTAPGIHPAAWALLGLGVGAGIFWLVSRSRRNVTDPDAPPAIS